MTGFPGIERDRGKSTIPGTDPLGTYRKYLEWEQERYKSIPLGEYINGVYLGLLPERNRPKDAIWYPASPRNSAELLVRALTQATIPGTDPVEIFKPVRNHEAGYTDYTVFSQRKDKLALIGIPRTTEAFMRYLIAESKLNTQDRALLVVFPTGSGKSTLLDLVSYELERYTASVEPAPVYGIEGCPINEEPLHILDEKTRAIWQKQYGITVTGHLCPDCRSKIDIKRGTLDISKLHKGIPLDFNVRALPFSMAQSKGIGRLPSSFTKYGVGYAHAIAERIKGSNRGFLRIDEMGECDQEFLKTTMNDLFRGRKYSIEKNTYELDTFIIADMTIPQWAKFKGPMENRNLLERIKVIFATYPLDSVSELDIINKRLYTSEVSTGELPHFSPDSLRNMAEIAVRSRYRGGDGGGDLKISGGEKSRLYRGLDLGPYAQKDRKQIEKEGRAKKEGETGISPPASWGIIYELIGEEMPHLDEGKKAGCVNFLNLIRIAEIYLEQDPPTLITDEDKKIAKNSVEDVKKEYNEWLFTTMEIAFYENFSARATAKLREYITNVMTFLDPENEKIIDRHTGKEVGSDSSLMEEFENNLSGGSIEFVQKDDDVKDLERHKKMTRYRFRRNMTDRTGKIRLDHGRLAESIDFPEYSDGFKRCLQKEWAGKKIRMPIEILAEVNPKDKEAEELAKMKERLVQEWRFCGICAEESYQHTRTQLRDATTPLGAKLVNYRKENKIATT